MSLFNWLERWALICRLKLSETLSNRHSDRSPEMFRQRLLRLAEASVSPRAFRRNLILSAENPQPFHRLIQPWQQADFASLDAAWLQLAGRSDSDRYQRAYIERPRGHAKTSDMALQIAWILLFSTRPVQGLAAAADRDQASLLWEAVERIARLNPELCAELQFRKHVVSNPRTGSRLEVISSDVQSSWGALPDFVICDELCHWEKPDLWFSLLSSAAKKPTCVLTVLTNAGVGRGWQWDVRESARKSSAWYFSSLEGTQAPWITPRALQEQKDLLPRPVYERLWLNQWQHSDGEFVTLAEAEACRDPALKEQHRGQPNRRYVAAIDFAEKHDYTVGVLIHREGSRIVVDRMDVVVPTPTAPTRVDWVEKWIREIATDFSQVTFIIDEYQLLGTIQNLEQRYDIHRFAFRAGLGNHALAVYLRKLIIHREVAWYPGCGQLTSADIRDDIETELASLILKQSASGRLRIDHLQDQVHHDDRSFALGAACLHLAESSSGGDWLQVTPPAPTGEFNW